MNGWKELLQSVGFRFEPAANGIPSSVFFPQSDPDDRLTYCSSSLQALLGLLLHLFISHCRRIKYYVMTFFQVYSVSHFRESCSKPVSISCLINQYYSPA